MTRLGLIWAQAHDRVIGADGGMPWHVPEDLAHFKQITLGSPVVMGRRTWESFPERFRPLPGRRNIVLTRRADWAADGAERADSLADAMRRARDGDPDWVWIIGGGELLAHAIGGADRLEVTELDLEVAGDTRAPQVDGWQVVASDPAELWHTSRTGIRYRFRRLEP
ncbi:dihydrofolate reductase [Microbacterium kribbense]|uniref:Dihydrofolate reductase n=1 Tax=Microbacterium kribbense TaxID=433645 RepID=A0ABP7GF82_9MICO